MPPAPSHALASTALEPDALDRYLARLGLGRAGAAGAAGVAPSVAELHAAHVRTIPYEDLDIHLGVPIRLDLPGLVDKVVDRRRGGYCYEQNTLFAAALEALGHPLTRHLGRVRLGDAASPRPATHMVLLVAGQVVDVGFGAATPLGPVPLGGEATYGGWTWRSVPARTPEGEDGWMICLSDQPLYTFTEDPRHPVDYLAPNHYSSTHPLSMFTQHVIAQRWDGDVQLGLVDGVLTERRADGSGTDVAVGPADLGAALRDQFGIDLGEDEVARVAAATAAALRLEG